MNRVRECATASPYRVHSADRPAGATMAIEFIGFPSWTSPVKPEKAAASRRFPIRASGSSDCDGFRAEALDSIGRFQGSGGVCRLFALRVAVTGSVPPFVELTGVRLLDALRICRRRVVSQHQYQNSQRRQEQ